MDFDLVGDITDVQTIAAATESAQRLRRSSGKSYWRKMNGQRAYGC